MSRAFVSESQEDFMDDDSPEVKSPLPPGTKNYMTPEGAARMREELASLTGERTRLAGTVAHEVSGSETDREELIAGRKRVREIDRRREYLSMMLEKTEVVDNRNKEGDRVLFGARVTVREDGNEKTYRIVGVDEADPQTGAISWLSPVAKGLLSKRAGDEVTLKIPGGTRSLTIIRVVY